MGTPADTAMRRETGTRCSLAAAVPVSATTRPFGEAPSRAPTGAWLDLPAPWVDACGTGAAAVKAIAGASKSRIQAPSRTRGP